MKDLTVGKPGRVLLAYSLPLFGSIIFQQLYNIADSFVAGHFISTEALAAVGNSSEITLIFIAIAFGCNIGTSVVTANLFGQKEMKQVHTCVTTALIFCGILGVLLSAVGILTSEWMLTLLDTPVETMKDSVAYIQIYLMSYVFLMLYQVATGIFSALGDSKTPFYFLAASSLSNIGADILFVTAFKMGVAGVAWATFICQGVSCILALVFVFARLKTVETEERAPLFSGEILGKIARIAIPSVLQQSFISVGNIIIQGVINTFGTAVMAGYSSGVKLNNLVITSFTTLGNGVSNFTAQNIGAGKYDRVKSGYWAGTKMVWMLSVPLIALYFFFGDKLSMLFLENPTELALKTSVTYLRILAPFYIVVSAKLVADGVLRGSGRMKQFMASTFTDLLLRVALAVVLSGTALGSTGIWLAWPIGWCVATAISIYFCRRGIKSAGV